MRHTDDVADVMSRGPARRVIMGAMKGVLKFVVGVGVPILLVGLLLSTLGNYRFSDPPPPAPLDTEPPDGEGAVQLVGSPDGRWVLADDSSYVGYRVVEHYPSRTTTGVGRTTDVEAEMMVADATITEVEVRADLRELTSDRGNRDRAAHGRYLEADDHPLAIFSLTEPVSLTGAEPGSPFAVEAQGELTVRDITRPITVTLTGRWGGGEVQVVGSTPVRLPDYDIRVPDISGFVTVEPDAEIEFDLTFARATP